MTKRRLMFVAMTAMALVPVEARAAHGTTGNEIGYFLPKQRVAVLLSQRITRCPTPGNPNFDMVSTIEAEQATVADTSRFFRIDTRAGFLAKRTIDVKLNPNGTLIAVNAKTEGQGGAVLNALIKVASTTGSLAFGAAGVALGLPKSPHCKTDVFDAIAERKRLADQITKLETNLVQGPLPAEQAEHLAALRTRFDALTDALTITTDPVLIDPGPKELSGFRHSGAPKYEWFDGDWAFDKHVLGSAGLLVRWKTAAQSYGKTSVPGDPTKPSAAVYYRRGVSGTVTVSLCASPALDDGMKECTEDKSADAAALEKKVKTSFPQLSPLFSMTVGHGGLFGSRELALEFDENGLPKRISYGSDPGAADIAGAIDAAGTAVTTLHGADQAALDREIAKLKSRKEYRELKAELEKD